MGRIVKAQLTILTLMTALLLAACSGSSGDPSPISPAAPIGNAMPSVRCLMPADLDADGRADVIAPTGLNRLLIQAPKSTAIDVRFDGQKVDTEIFSFETADGRYLHEVQLASNVNTNEVKITAGDYELFFTANSNSASIGPCEFEPVAEGLSNDIASPNGFYFRQASSVRLRVTGLLPPLAFEGLRLVEHSNSIIELDISLDQLGIVLTPAALPKPNTVYSLKGAPDAVDAIGERFKSDVHVMCGHSASDEALKLAQADLNRDGKPEVLALFADGSVASLVNTKGDADFLLKPTGVTGIALGTGDFDGNGATDVVTLEKTGSRYRLLYFLNKTLTNKERFTIEPVEFEKALNVEAPIACVCADFDRDGITDTAVLDVFGTVHIISRAAKHRSFQAFQQRTLCCGMTCNDTNGDGKPDLTILAANGLVSKSMNNGKGSFKPNNTTPIDVSPANRVSSGNLNGDLGRDLIFSGGESSFLVLAGKTNIFMRYQLSGADEFSISGAVNIADVNNDSRDDLLVVKEEADGIGSTVAVYLSGTKPSGSPDSLIQLGVRVHVHDICFWNNALVYATSAGVLAQDVDSESLPPTADSPVRFIKAFKPVPAIPAPLAAAIADFNDDGRADMAAVGADGMLRVWVSGELGEPFAPVGEPVYLGGKGSLKAIDFDRDNSPDLLFIPHDTSIKPRILRNRGNAGFDTNDNGLLPHPPTGLRGAPALGDFDRDGDLDALWPSPLGRLQYNDDGRWRDSRDSLEVRDSSNMRLQFSGELCCADFTGDGVADVVAVMQRAVMQGGEEKEPQQVLVLLQGTIDSERQPFLPIVTHKIKGRIFDLIPADFNGDGKLDIALGVATTDTNASLMLLQLGTNFEFESFEGSPAAKGELQSLALDDVDRDGDLDLIASEIVDSKGVLTLWVNLGNGKFNQADKAQASLERAIGDFTATNLSLADFTGDGRSDLLAIDQKGNVVIVRTTLP